MAIAPERMGIGIRRHFTTEGVHPYDTVEWERRDARIVNFKDGSVAFEQKDVEVPSTWSVNATNILAQKYFRGTLGTPEREWSLKQVADRVADTITGWGVKDGYFVDADEAEAFNAELKYLIVHQRAAFNSPVWFNIGVSGVPQQASACFILSVDDTMDSILNWYAEEGVIFKGGSGAGVNLSKIRSSYEALQGGGTASGPVSFMRGADASAGTIKSGGKTRRAAKMVILDSDHPDIEDFIWCKAIEERKARVLRDAGFDMDLDGKDSHSLQYQNANNSVRVTDEFMNAVVDDADWHLRAVTTGEVIKTVKARELFRQIAKAAWECADPGMQFDTTINRWHTAHTTGRINGSNPCCFTGDALVSTPHGLVSMEVLEKMASAGEELPEAYAYDRETRTSVVRRITNAWIAGETATLVDVETQNGVRVRCTPEHRFLLASGEYVEARHLAEGATLRSITDDGLQTLDAVYQVEAVTLKEPVKVYDIEVDGTHNFTVTSDGYSIEHGLVVHNSEYMHLDNSACNLASLNLLKFLPEGGAFDVEGFKAAVEVIFTAQEILVGNADYPTEKIAETSRRFRQLGIGYANLGALLMALGLPYDSDEGRSLASAITALLTGQSYATSARTAARMGPFAGYADNKEHMLRVLRMHRDETANIDEEAVPADLLDAAREAWDTAVELGEKHGVRNSQASVLAPTGCLVGGSLVPTERGLVRLRSLGDTEGAQWQDLGIGVQTDEGVKEATKFYVNGLEPVVSVETSHGYRIQGTPQHRIKVVDGETGEWVWRRFGEIAANDVVPLALHQLVGEPQTVPLPPLPDAYWTVEHHAVVPRSVNAELAELVGYFMGDGSLHARGLRFCVSGGDSDVVERLSILGKELFNLQAHVSEKRGYTEVRFDSVRLVLWWEACGFAKRAPEGAWDGGKGYVAHVPDAVLHANDPAVYRAFVRGLFEADGDTSSGYPNLKNTSHEMVRDVQAILLALGYPTTKSVRERTDAWGKAPLVHLRLLNQAHNERWLDEIGFISARKNRGLHLSADRQAGRYDYIPLSRGLVDRLVPENDRLRKVLLMGIARGRVSRRAAGELYERTGDAELGHLLGFFYDRVASAELGEEELTYDLSVPDNVTYIANGFVSHNTIGLLMDCDTTGIEPDLGLVKMKKLVGGGTMSIVNQTVPRALRRLGYTDTQIAEIVSYIDEHKSIIGAPHLSADHLAVFACSMGDNTIHYMGHIRMMGAVQPWISGAISKCVAGPTLLTTSDGLVRIGSLHRNEAPDTFRDEVIEVASIDGTQKTDAFYYGGERHTFELVLRSGQRVITTPNHRLLLAGFSGLEWKQVDDIAIGDYVAVQYGADMWSPIPARFDDFEPSPAYGAQKAVTVPTEMTEDLSLLLGAYAAEGHTSRSTWTITITNSVESVLERVVDLWNSVFGVDARITREDGKCPGVVVHSKTIVEFFEYLGVGATASKKRIPDAVLRSPRESVLAFLSGLVLDAYTTTTGMPKWAICVDSRALLDDLQAVLTNLGVVHGRISKVNADNGKTYDEVYACGPEAQKLVSLVPFLEPHKAERAEALAALPLEGKHNTADVVPGVLPAELYRLLPEGKGLRSEFSFLCDPRTNYVSRRTLERVAAVPGVVLPSWLRTVLDDGLHFVPVESVSYSGIREVFDVSVPATHAFVGNGIVNHNTVNMPEEATVEEVEQLHIDAWKLGIKAVAIYRDNCKVAQPLSTVKKDKPASEPEAHDQELAAKVEELEQALANQTTVVVKQPIRERLPRKRRSTTFAFRVADCEGYVHVGEYEDGRPGEVFIKVSKQGSTLAGIMDAFSISVSLGLQHGVPLKTYVQKYTNMRFEPAGMTDDPDLRIASSLVDYIFRRLAVDYLPYEERVDLGVLTTQERIQPTLPGVEEATVEDEPMIEGGTEPVSEPQAPTAQAEPPAVDLRPEPAPQVAHSDAPFCMTCGVQMVRAGSCHACPSCGSTSGCS